MFNYYKIFFILFIVKFEITLSFWPWQQKKKKNFDILSFVKPLKIRKNVIFEKSKQQLT